jgi:hypothetical protein
MDAAMQGGARQRSRELEMKLATFTAAKHYLHKVDRNI